MRVVLRLVAALLGLGAAVLGVLLLIELVGLWSRPDQGGLVVPWRSVQGAPAGGGGPIPPSGSPR